MAKLTKYYLIDSFTSKNDCFTNNGILYVHDAARRLDQMVLKEDVPKVLLEAVPKEMRRSLSDGLEDRAAVALFRDRSFEVDLNELKKQSQHLVNIRNGVFDIKTGCFYKGDEADALARKYHFTYVLNFELKEDVTLEEALVFKEFLQNSLDYDEYPEKAKLLSEIIGVSVSSLQDVRKALFLIGATRSGKSVVAELVRRIHIPQSCVSFLGFHQLGGNFETIKLLHSRLNICKEISARKIPHTDIIKELISHEDVYLQEKRQVGFSGVPHCQFLSCGNVLPQFGEMDAGGNEALIDRMVVLHFGHSVPKDKVDRQLVDKLWEERDVIFSLAMKALVELYQRNYEFTYPDDSRALLESYAQQSRSFEMFVEECCQLDGKIHSDTLFKAYHQYCKDNCFKPYSDNEVRAYIGNSLPQLFHKKFTLNGYYRWGWEGLSLKAGEIVKEIE